LGAAEAGFFPGVIVYLTHWFSRRDLAKAIASFMVAQPLANFVGSPLAGRILQIRWYGLEGWRWLFILEGIPAVIFGIVTFFYLTDRPSQAEWLPQQERDWINHELDRERVEKKAVRSYTIAQAMRQRDVLLLTLIYFLANTGFYGFTIWFPTILKRASGLTTRTVTLLVAIPYLAALTATLLNSWHSDRSQERRWHAAGPLFAGSAALFLAICANSHLWMQLGFFSVFASCVYGYQPCFWALPTITLGESAAAASIGLINAIGNLGGFFGPFVLGYLVTRTGSFNSGLVWLVFDLAAAGMLVLVLGVCRTPSAKNS
jgi:sugar phosphate permease